MGVNSYQGQLAASSQSNYSFPAYTDLMPLIIADYKDDPNNQNNRIFYLKKIGIQAQPETVVRLTNSNFGAAQPFTADIRIGKTGFYEANNVHITGIQFLEDTSYDVIIDYIIKYDIV